MVINKHGSFYLRNGWGTKIIKAIDENNMIFSPSNEQDAIDNIGLGRVMIKSMRYWSVVLGLSEEVKVKNGIKHKPTSLFKLIKKYDLFFQDHTSLILLHRNLANNKENATAWYWAFNELGVDAFDKKTFCDRFYAYLGVNNMDVKRAAVEKEYNCFKNTYIGDSKFDIRRVIDEEPRPLFAPLKLLKVNENKLIEKVHLRAQDIPTEVLIYCISEDNQEESTNQLQLDIDKLIEEKNQVGKYFNIRYSRLIEMLRVAENKGIIKLNHNFGNRHIEFLPIDYKNLIDNYYLDRNYR